VKERNLSDFLAVPWRVLFFFMGLVCYAAFSSPTPDEFSWAEVTVLTLLGMSVTPPKLDKVGGAEIFLGYGLTVPIFLALVRGHDLVAVMRDLIPFLFLFLPMAYKDVADSKHFMPYFPRLLVLMGLLFSLRTVGAAWRGEGFDLWEFSSSVPPDFLYLANSPEVLFAELALQAWAFHYLGMLGNWGRGVLMFFLAAIPIVAMSIMQQRAFLSVSLVYVLCLSGLVLWKNPKGFLRCLLFLGVATALLYPFLENIFSRLMLKTQLVGLNSRLQEWAAVRDILSVSAARTFFGMGWGEVFENPAVGGLPVGYTHSLLSSLWLKTGLVGVGLAAWAGISFLKGSERAGNKVVFWLIPALLSVLVTLSLYASHKSLGFGLLLLLAWVLLKENRKLEKSPPFMP
jgi:hypothetical protein